MTPPKYKARIAVEPKLTNDVVIRTKFNHNHEVESLKKVVQHGIKKKMKEYIEPMLVNNVKTRKILKILEEYVNQGKIKRGFANRTALLPRRAN